MGANEYLNMLDMLNIGMIVKKLGEEAVDFFADVDTFHGASNFLLENLTSSSGDLQIKSSKAINSDALLEIAAFFKDKTNFEIDQTGAGSIKIAHDHELYVGFGNKWVSSGDDRSQLVTAVHDSIYANAGYKSSGSLSQVQMMVERIQAQFANSKYFYVKSVESPDLQTYMLIAPKDPDLVVGPPALYDPLILDLDNDGLETVGLEAGVLFDHSNDGTKNGTGWVGKDDGFLVLDRNSDGQITTGSELFGDNTTLQNGTKSTGAFQALADIDSNKDGVINAADNKFADLRVWQDANQDGISQTTELKKLTELHIASINTQSTELNAVQKNGNVQLAAGSYTRDDGTVGNAGAFNFLASSITREFKDKLDTSSVADVPNVVGYGSVRDLREAIELAKLCA